MNDPSVTTVPPPPAPADMGRQARAAGLAGQPPDRPKSTSRKVTGYVLRCLKARKARAIYQARVQRLDPLKKKADDLVAEATAYYGRLTGGQIAEAERIMDGLGCPLCQAKPGHTDTCPVYKEEGA